MDCVNVSWESIWEQAEVIKVMCKDFSQTDQVPPTEFWLFCLTETKDEQLWFVVCDIIL